MPGFPDEQMAASTDSLESSGSNSSEYIPTRTTATTPRLPSHNPLHFVKVQSPLYKKAEQQIKLTKEVKISREALKEGEEEWQSNLDNWKSRRRKVSEKVIQRAEEMRQIEAEEQLRQEKLLLQQKKIKKFAEIVENKSSRSYNLDLYIGPGDDSGLGATPEPDDTLDCQSCLLRSDTSEEMTSEAESVDSDIHKSEKMPEKEPPKVPLKPYSRFKKSASNNQSNSTELFQRCLSNKDFDAHSSTEPSDVEGHAADTEATSSEEDVAFSGQIGLSDPGVESLRDNRRGDLAESASDNSTALEKIHFTSQEAEEETKPTKERSTDIQMSNGYNQSFKICIKHGDVRGFGFTLKGGKDQGSPAYIENVVKGSPAEEIGLKDGDKIVSLNGELTAEYSHASLIFSIKQALYTGILDIVINRSENCESLNTEIKITESRKGKSFAEKLAIFTSGVNTPTVNTEEPKLKSAESKKESLVLRRRSAFENESKNIVNRRSSCVSQPVNTSCEKTLEKRHSVDFALGQNLTHENTSNKKGPPPPVPVKPKIKSKPAYFELNKSVIKTNESPPSSAENSCLDSPKEPKKVADSLETSLGTENDTNERNLDESFVTEQSFPQYDKICDVSSHQTQLLSNVDEPTPSHYDLDQVGGNTTDKHCASFEANGLELASDLCNANVYSLCNDNENITEDLCEEICKDSFEQESDIGYYPGEMCTVPEQLINGASPVHDNADKERTTEGDANDMDLEGNLMKAEANSAPSACDNKSPVTEEQDLQVLGESETAETETHSSPLCLSLEKIDEDDVISASTTSSDTPDTETVIETLPSNVSPLPNDESNGEDSTKLLSFREEQPLGTNSSTEMSSSVIGGEEEISPNCHDKGLEPFSTSVSDTEEMGKSYYNDQQDEEYARELDESLDQITSLDIIDRIEQSLMDQLQKEDSYEDISSNLNERDIANPWLFYSEESELLEDLTPRNLEPPRDPPPPPPPPELENKVMPISRNNSTKRIKKELWRRRSDFLGLQSPEAVDVDNIPPPPPGLEELLKQEREQTQWLEKRLSSAEPEPEISSYAEESPNYNDYSDYFVESPKEAEPEQWKENMEEESLFDATYGLQYESAPETPPTVIENVKQCESPQHKAKQNIQSLGAAPKAKIMDNTQWITEKAAAVVKKPIESQMSCNPNYWLAQDGGRQACDRRYSMPPVYSSTHPDVTVRTWGDREYEYEQHRPRSAIYDSAYNQYEKKDLKRTQSLDRSYETDTLESEVHKCSCCGKGLCEGSAMGIEALRLYFHIECFRCCLCSIQLGNGSCGTDVQVKNNQLYCPSCFTVD